MLRKVCPHIAVIDNRFWQKRGIVLLSDENTPVSGKLDTLHFYIVKQIMCAGYAF